MPGELAHKMEAWKCVNIHRQSERKISNMKSIKPGRGPSMMQGISSIAVALFGVIWTIAAASMGGGIFALFGIIFIGIAVVQAVYNFKNATGENRYSAFDITEGNEEPDPLNERFGVRQNMYEGTAQDAYETSYQESQDVSNDRDSEYCPYCGIKVNKDFVYCNQCGKKLP